MLEGLRREQQALSSLHRFAFILLGDLSGAGTRIDSALLKAREECPASADIYDLRLYALRALYKTCSAGETSASESSASEAGRAQGARSPDEAQYLSRLRSLPMPARAAAALVIVEQLSYEEASFVTGAENEEIKRQVNSARQQLFPKT